MAEGRAIEFIRYSDEDPGRLEVTEEAIEALQSIKGPVGCISVCGRARTGKSFILNQLLGTAAGFKVGPTYKPCTRGIWLWSAPVPQTAADGSTYHLVLLDTEGIDSYEQTTQEGVQVFSLAVLLSSLFVFNQMGGIDEAALDRLSLISELTKHIRVKAREQGGAVTERELGGFAPSFLWLLRDFYLQLDDNGRKVTPKEYLEIALRMSPGKGPNVESKNQIRESIKSLFPDRDCFTLLRPAHDEEHLQDLDSAPPEVLRPEFRQGVADLVSLLFRRALPKAMGEEGVLTGRTLAALAVAYTQAINQGAIPTITSAWLAVADAECQHAVSQATECYVNTFNLDTEPEDGPIIREHQRALEAAVSLYHELCVGSDGLKRKHEKALVAGCEKKREEIAEGLKGKAAAEVDYQLYRGASYLSTVGRTVKNWGEMEVEVQRVVEDFTKRTQGPTKFPKLAEFVQQQYSGAAQDFIAKAEGEVRELQAETKALRGELEATKAELALASQRQLAAAKAAVNGHTYPPPPRGDADMLGCCTRPRAY